MFNDTTLRQTKKVAVQVLRVKIFQVNCCPLAIIYRIPFDFNG